MNGNESAIEKLARCELIQPSPEELLEGVDPHGGGVAHKDPTHSSLLLESQGHESAPAAEGDVERAESVRGDVELAHTNGSLLDTDGTLAGQAAHAADNSSPTFSSSASASPSTTEPKECA